MAFRRFFGSGFRMFYGFWFLYIRGRSLASVFALYAISCKPRLVKRYLNIFCFYILFSALVIYRTSPQTPASRSSVNPLVTCYVPELCARTQVFLAFIVLTALPFAFHLNKYCTARITSDPPVLPYRLLRSLATHDSGIVRNTILRRLRST